MESRPDPETSNGVGTVNEMSGADLDTPNTRDENDCEAVRGQRPVPRGSPEQGGKGVQGTKNEELRH